MAKHADGDAKTAAGGGGKDVASVPMTGGRNLYQGVDREGFGMKMLASMGWEEGKGIGKNGKGITKHLHAKKRAMNSGIGADVRSDASGKMDWTLNAVSFDNILKGLNQAYAPLPNEAACGEGQIAAAVGAKSEQESDEEEAEEEKERGGSSKKEKEKKKGKKKEVGRSAVGHAGRYSKRESQKRVRNYSAGDLDAILCGIGGFAAVPGTAAAEYARADAVGNSEAVASESDDGDDDSGSDGDVKVKTSGGGGGGGKKEKMRKEKTCTREEERVREKKKKEAGRCEPSPSKSDKKRADAVIAAAETKIKRPPLPAPPPDWWGWTVGFVPSGYMGEARDDDDDDDGVGANRKRGFDEADQERLAIAAHDGANKGKKGLGTGSHVMSNPKKVAGGNWEGKKMRFDEEGGAEGDDDGGGDGGGGKKSRWGKLAVKMVTKAGGKMPVGDILKKLKKKAKKKESEGKDSGDLEDEMRAELRRCSSLVVGDSVVELHK